MGVCEFVAKLDREPTVDEFDQLLNAGPQAGVVDVKSAGATISVTAEAGSLNAAILKLVKDADRLGFSVIRIDHDYPVKSLK